MPYLIDGHNLIAFMPDISLDDPNDEAKLVERLKAFMMRKRKKCTVVFDHGLPGGVNPNLSNSQVEVLFAHSRSKADYIIRERLDDAPDPRSWQVVTSDSEVAAAARTRGASVISSAQFAAMLAGARKHPSRNGEEANPRMSPAEYDYFAGIFGVDDSNHRPK